MTRRWHFNPREAVSFFGILSVVLGHIFSVGNGKRSGHVLIAPPGHGNMGDQALCDSFFENVDGPITLIVTSTGEHELPPDGRVTELVMPHLLRGGKRVRAASWCRLALMARSAKTVAIMGVDMMDGGYGVVSSVSRSQLAAMCARTGVPTRILGFSWNASPAAPAARAIRKADEAGAELVARDPLSEERLRTLGCHPISGADLVFAATTVDTESADQLLAGLGVLGGRYALVNASALVARTHDQTPGYVEVLELLRAAGITPVLLPHVDRTTGRDIDALLQIAAGSVPGTAILHDVPRPAVVRGLCRNAEIVISGRMHLGVMALLMGAVPVVVSTQGKVQGLLRLFGVEELTVDTGAAFAENLRRAVGAAVDGRADLAARIAGALPSVKQKAARNVAGPWQT